jgi:hypothetical protein
MGKFLFLVCVLTLVSCGKSGKNGKNGLDGSNIAGLNGSSTGVDFGDIEPGLACESGGVSIFTFKDSNSDGMLQSGESVIKVKSVCNGVNGSAGADGATPSITLESVSASSACPTGGVKISSGSSSATEVCNGVNGLNGEQGLPGVQGIPGIAGSNGADGKDASSVTPVQFCKDDKSQYPEYGLMIGGELYAVYWGTTPASPKTQQAFLTKLVAGQYSSTGGNNCLFQVK